jgi:cullin 1
MVILLLLNKVLTWTVEQIQDETQIKLELLLQVLLGLLKSKLLICTDINENELDEDFKDTDIKINYSIRLATDFKR